MRRKHAPDAENWSGAALRVVTVVREGLRARIESEPRMVSGQFGKDVEDVEAEALIGDPANDVVGLSERIDLLVCGSRGIQPAARGAARDCPAGMSTPEAGAASDDYGAAIVVTRLFTDALDARDLDALRVLVADNVEFRDREGGTLTGWDAMKTVVEVCDNSVSAFEVLT